MKNSRRCTKCECPKLFVVEQCSIPLHDSKYGTAPLTVAAAYLPSGETGFWADENKRFEATVEAWVCAACGYTELYSRTDALRYMVENDHPGVQLLQATSGPEPYR